MSDLTCPHCGFVFQVEKPPAKKREIPPAKIEACSAFLETWNAFATEQGLPKVRENNQTIRAMLLTRLREKTFPEDFMAALELIKAKAFYRGYNDTKWKASLEYLLKPGKADELASKFRAEQDHGTRAGQPSSTSRLLSRSRIDEGLPEGPEMQG